MSEPTTFSPGDVVRLKSGGLKMTVTATSALAVWTVFHFRGRRIEGSVPRVCLERVEPEPEADVPDTWQMKPAGDGRIDMSCRGGNLRVWAAHGGWKAVTLTPAEAREFASKLMEFADAKEDVTWKS